MRKSLLFALACGLGLTACAPATAPAETSPLEALAAPTEPAPTAVAAAVDTGCPVRPFMDAWGTGDIAGIRNLYAPNGRYFSESDLQLLQTQQPFDASVGSPNFVEAVQDHDGTELRMLADPLVVADKLVGLAYGWERAGSQLNGAALLRCEGGRILLHVALQSDMPDSPTEDMLPRQMQAWTDRDVEGAQTLYAADAVILADEDLLEVQWRDFQEPPSIQMLLDHFYGWAPVINGEPVVIEDLAVFGWGWSRFEAPIGKGVRLIKVASDRIVIDIRLAIRPWEAQGREFLPGY